MTDYALKFADKATFDAITRAVYEQFSGVTLRPDESTPRQGLSLTGTHWFVDEIGPMYDRTDPQNHVLIPGHFANLRWNGGDDPPPSEIPGMEVVWRSAAVDSDGNPIPMPSWWSRVIA